MTSEIYNQRSFHARLNYCLEDKLVLNPDGQKVSEFKNRAEILYCNQCYGSKNELIQQFNEVARLNHNVIEPVFHVVLALTDHDAGDLLHGQKMGI